MPQKARYGPYNALAVVVACAAALGLRPAGRSNAFTGVNGSQSAFSAARSTLEASARDAHKKGAAEAYFEPTASGGAKKLLGPDSTPASKRTQRAAVLDLEHALRYRTEERARGTRETPNPFETYAPPPPVGADGRLKDFLQGEIALLSRIRRAHQTLEKVISELWAARSIRRRATRSLEAAAARRTVQQTRLEKRTARVSQRYRALYKMADGWTLRPLFTVGGHDSVPLDGRVQLAYALAREMNELSAEKRVLAALEKECTHKAELVENARRRVLSLDRKRDDLQAAIARLAQHLKDLRRRKEHRNRTGEVWNRKLRRLNRNVRDLAALVKEEQRSFLALKGTLPRPVPGMIIRRFGTERVAGTRATVRRRGIEISAMRGWKARSPAAGKVRFAGAVPGFHNVVILDHGEGFLSVLGKLGRLEVAAGQRVRAGQPLGFVHVDRKCRRWDCTTCYYELRRGAVALNPHKWFRSGRKPKRKKHRRTPRPPSGPTGASSPASNLAGR